jgi:hypothetical protein
LRTISSDSGRISAILPRVFAILAALELEAEPSFDAYAVGHLGSNKLVDHSALRPSRESTEKVLAIIYVAIELLKPFDRNAKTHPNHQIHQTRRPSRPVEP